VVTRGAVVKQPPRARAALASPTASDYLVEVFPVDTAVVLAAGRGSRLGALTAALPKPLLAVAGRPIVAHVLTGLVRAGVRRAIVITGYRAAQIEEALGDGSALGLSLAYRRQPHADGTARSLLLAESAIDVEAFVLCWGDVLVPTAFYGELLAAFAAHPCDVLLAANPVDDPWRGAALYVDEAWRVTRLEEKPPRGMSTTRWNNAGIMVLRRAVFDYARRVAPSSRGEYEFPEAVAEMIRDGRAVYARPVHGPWADVGTPEDLAAAHALFAGEP
jgi:dTDP-glucose pyrophosphorylase